MTPQKKLLDNILIRTILFPFVTFFRFLGVYMYQLSSDSKKIKSMKNIHKGKRCFIIGNGPSLRAEDLDKIKNEISFGSNKIFYIFPKTLWRPTYYVCGDVKVFKQICEKINDLNLSYVFLESALKPYIKKKLQCIYFRCWYKFRIKKDNIPRNIKVSVKPYKFFSCCGTITYISLQLAIFMGFEKIYLLGIDNNFSNSQGKNHFSEDKSEEISAPPNIEESNTIAYKSTKRYADEHGIKIYNATRGGKLEVFERVDFDSLFSEEDKK